ncbi:MAG: hypothetical protein ACREA0_21985 [bacterium]
MKLRSVAVYRAIDRGLRLVGVGLILVAGVSGSEASAENEPKPGAGPSKTVPAPKQKPPRKADAKTNPGPPECMRIGQRVIAALARDDSGAAGQFYAFYTAFKCPQQRLSQSFGCLVNLQTTNPSLANPSPEHVAQCWDDPSAVPVVQPPSQPATTTSEGTK